MRTAELTGLPERLELFFAQTTHLQGPVLSSSGGHCGGGSYALDGTEVGL